MIIIAAITAVIYRQKSVGTRLFPLTVLGTGEVVYPQFAYPYRPQFIAPWLDALLAAAVPVVVILLAQVRVRSFWDANNGIVGLVYALLASSCFQVFMKWVVGGLRPHFYDACQPDPSLTSGIPAAPATAMSPASVPGPVSQFDNNASSRRVLNLNPVWDLKLRNGGEIGLGYQHYMYTTEICRGSAESVRNALQSFPSGHATTIFAGMVFLSLYLNAKLKVFADHHAPLWKLVALWLPVLGACLVAGSLTVDHSHNWYDIVAGAAIGTAFAVSAYRMVYAAVWDWRFNHIPLNRSAAFVPGYPVSGLGRCDDCEGADAVFTKQAGWGTAIPGPRQCQGGREKSPAQIRDRNGDGFSGRNGQNVAYPQCTAHIPCVRGDEMV
ncbi:hypothetical protein SLS62_000372 [Diatrype stigma]|uniref:Phosphatidic acid phosphatase type 2/haloperoxidase domain-containing protein n=1 Tax=Diatrype stigma TaxID=117547 RepID=A0AAN9V3D6_9PEZI